LVAPLNKILVVVGVILSAIGILGTVFSIVPVPYITTRLENVLHKNVWLDESFEVPSYSWHSRHSIGALVPKWSRRATIRLTFESTDGGIAFRAMDEDSFAKFNSSQSYQYYTPPSRLSATSLNITWIPPTDTVIYFVWDNKDSSVPKSITARFIFEWTVLEDVHVIENANLLPTEGIFFCIPMFIVGIAIVRYGSFKVKF
jgi:hypothetical protein